MSRSILSAEERESYGTLPEEISERDLKKYFTLCTTELFFVESKASSASQLAYAIQFCATKYLGITLTNLTSVPHHIISYIAAQLRISDVQSIALTALSERTLQRQRSEVIDYLGLSAFAPLNPLKYAFLKWMQWNLWHSRHSLQHLFYESLSWLRRKKVLLPTAVTLERLILHLNDRIRTHTIAKLSRRTSPSSLDEVFLTINAQGQTLFESLRMYCLKRI